MSFPFCSLRCQWISVGGPILGEFLFLSTFCLLLFLNWLDYLGPCWVEQVPEASM